MSDTHQDRPRRANVELIKNIYAAFARRDMPAIFAGLAEDVLIVQSSELPWGGTYRGHAQAGQFFAKLTQAITSTVVLVDFIDAGDNVVALGRTQGTVNASGKHFDVPLAHVWTVRDGHVQQAGFYIDNETMQSAL